MPTPTDVLVWAYGEEESQLGAYVGEEKATARRGTDAQGDPAARRGLGEPAVRALALKSETIMERKSWSEAELNYCGSTSQTAGTDDLAQALNGPYTAVAQKASKLGLRKSRRHCHHWPIDSTAKGMKTRFKPGAAPRNKGTHYQ